MNTVNQPSVRGTIRISEDVICSIAALTTVSVNGVASMGATLTDGFTDLLGRKSWSKGVRIVDKDDDISIALNIDINVKYGYRVPDIALRIQERVKTAVEEHTNYSVSGVHVFVRSLVFDDYHS